MKNGYEYVAGNIKNKYVWGKLSGGEARRKEACALVRGKSHAGDRGNRLISQGSARVQQRLLLASAKMAEGRVGIGIGEMRVIRLSS